ncbi:MAG: ComEC/Rec2 family competence protein, partial [Pseudomonadales bacterium]
MQSVLLAFSLGVLAFTCAHVTPSLTAFLLFLAGACVPALVLGVRVSLIIALLAGYGLGTYSNVSALAERVPICSDREYRSLSVQITEVPSVQSEVQPEAQSGAAVRGRQRARFAARILEAADSDCHGLRDRTVRLSWYEPPDLRRGDIWQVSARIRPPWSYQNPGGFDFERWLLAKGLNGTGYVREGSLISRADAALAPGWQLQQRLRQWLLARQTRHAGIVFALLTGDGSLIQATVWQAFRSSGTIHLVVVSGLHVGIVVGGAFLFG